LRPVEAVAGRLRAVVGRFRPVEEVAGRLRPVATPMGREVREHVDVE
jgi:hypothetical protein